MMHLGMAALVALLSLHGYHLVHAGPNPNYLGLTDTTNRTVTLYDDGEPEALQRKVFAYEVGHVLDLECLTDKQRRYWTHLRHIHGRWYAPNYANERGTGAGDFADVFSAWATHSYAYFQGKRMSTRDMRTLVHRFHFQKGVCR